MEVQTISPSAFSVYISGEELMKRSLSPAAVTAAEALALISDLTGIRAGLPARLELYPGRHELLIFVRRCGGKPRYYRFATAEDAIAAVLGSAVEDPASLYFYQGRWLLAVWPVEGDPDRGLAEFGEPLSLPEGFLAHLREHGQALIDGQAVSVLRQTFR